MSTLKLEHIKGSDYWKVVEDWTVYLSIDCNVCTRYDISVPKIITVPKGFVSDLGSVPTLLESVVSNDRYTHSYVLHDFLYRNKITKRSVADYALFASVCKEVDYHVKSLPAPQGRFDVLRRFLYKAWLRSHPYLIWFAVRWFGWLYWRSF